jgi:hypothetical protein
MNERISVLAFSVLNLKESWRGGISRSFGVLRQKPARATLTLIGFWILTVRHKCRSLYRSFWRSVKVILTAGMTLSILITIKKAKPSNT